VKNLITLFALAITFAASAEYKVINLVNGTNDVQVQGAVLPIAIEVKSTTSNACVSVERLSEVSLLKKVYDITTNEIPWIEYQVDTNDFVVVSNRSLVVSQRALLSCGQTQKGFYAQGNEFFVDDKYLMYGDLCITNKDDFSCICKMMYDRFRQICSIGGGYVGVNSDGLYWATQPTSWEKVLSVSLNMCCSGNGMALAAKSFSSTLYASTDGTNWIEKTGSLPTPSSDSRVFDIGFVNGKFYITNHHQLYLSSDLENWTVVNLGVKRVVYGNGIYIAPSYFGSSVWVSFDGVTWEEGPNYNVYALDYIDRYKTFYISAPEAPWLSHDNSYNISTQDGMNSYSLSTLYSQDSNFITSFREDGMGNLYGIQIITSEISESYYMYMCKLQEIGNQKYVHESGIYGEYEKWTNGLWSIEYNPDGFDNDNYWCLKMGTYCTYSGERNNRPKNMYFDCPEHVIRSKANSYIDRHTNEIVHVDITAITNRVYNKIDRNVSQLRNICTVECNDGLCSEDITNRVFVIGGDKIVVDGVIQNETESTKATLIVE